MGVRRNQGDKGRSDVLGEAFLEGAAGEVEFLGCAKCGRAVRIQAFVGAPSHRVIARCTACDWAMDRSTTQFPAWFVRWPEGHVTTPPAYLAGDEVAGS